MPEFNFNVGARQVSAPTGAQGPSAPWGARQPAQAAMSPGWGSAGPFSPPVQGFLRGAYQATGGDPSQGAAYLKSIKDVWTQNPGINPADLLALRNAEHAAFSADLNKMVPGSYMATPAYSIAKAGFYALPEAIRNPISRATGFQPSRPDFGEIAAGVAGPFAWESAWQPPQAEPPSLGGCKPAQEEASPVWQPQDTSDWRDTSEWGYM